MPGAVIRRLIEPVPVYPWAFVHRRDAKSPELAALSSVVAELAGTQRWLELPAGAWLPSADAKWASRR